MSGQKLLNGRKITAAAIAALLGAPAYVYSAPPAAEKLNADPNVHWFASWSEQSNPPSADFIVTPSSANGVANAQTQYNASATANPSRPLGLLVEAPLSSGDASSLFNTGYPAAGGKAISYVFSDMEAGNATTQVANVTNLVKQVRASTWSKNAYVGHFDLTPISPGQDPSRRGAQPYTLAQYKSAKVNMSNTALYPGAPNFRNKSTNDWSNANIRTGLFIGPIERFTATQNVLDSSFKGKETLTIATDKHKHIPWVTRFNNWNNSSLDSDGISANGYQFTPGAPLPSAALSGTQTQNQMVGRGDFSSQILHYRMRGAYSVNLFAIGGPNGGGVVGYNSAAAEQDVRDGWFGNGGSTVGGDLGLPGTSLNPINHANNIFAQTDNQRATMTYNPIIDGNSDSASKRSEISGTLWSGVYSKLVPNPGSVNGKGGLDILASNLDSSNHKIKFGTIDVYDVFTEKKGTGTAAEQNYTYADSSLLSASRNVLIEAGMHRLLEFDLVTTRVYNSSTYAGSYSTKTIWLLNSNYLVFNNNNRMDVGVPEPTTFGMLAAAGSMAVVCRRHRRNKELAGA